MGKENVRKLLDKAVESFTVENLAEFFHVARFGGDVQLRRYSAFNRYLCFLEHARDARSFNQWREAGRCVKKGAKAFYIAAPMKRTRDKESEEERLFGFRAFPVFRFEDTEGEELSLPEELPRVTPRDYRLEDVARFLRFTLKADLSWLGSLGEYVPGKPLSRICTDTERSFFLDLVQAIDLRLGNYSEPVSGTITAEAGGCCLASLYGCRLELENARRYISTASGGKHPGLLLARVLGRVMAAAEFIERFGRERQALGGVA